jgi:ribosomal protein L7/L12
MDRKIPNYPVSPTDRPTAYEIDGMIITNKVIAVKYVKEQLKCSVQEAIQYVESLTE